MLSTIVYGCLKNQELPPPVITISQAEDEILNFSTFQSATVNVHIDSGEELKTFDTWTTPRSSWNDTTIVFDPYTYTADINLSFRIQKGFVVSKRDSIFDVAYTVHTEDTSCTVRRKLRYRFTYPELDSFDVKVESAMPNGKCLLDIDNRCAYKYTDYTNQNYDLVYVCEMDPNEFAFGTALVSPDAPYLQRYFRRKFPSLSYRPEKPRATQCGIIADSNIPWSSFNSAILGDENNWVQSTRINALSPSDGVGVYDLQKSVLYKFRLYNGRFVMIRILDRVYPQYTDKSVMTLRVYLQD